MKKIIMIRDTFKNMFVNKNFSKMVYFKTENEVHIYLESGTIVIIGLTENVLYELQMLKFYNDNRRDVLGTGDLKYIDIRILGKVFTCNDKVLCSENLRRIYPNYYKR